MSRHWNWNEEEARKCNGAKVRARRTVKEILGSVLLAPTMGVHPRTVLAIANADREDNRRAAVSVDDFLRDLQ